MWNKNYLQQCLHFQIMQMLLMLLKYKSICKLGSNFIHHYQYHGLYCHQISSNSLIDWIVWFYTLQDVFNDEIFLHLSYLGSGIAAIIAFKLFQMENLTFLNKIFLLYFSLDSVAGLAQTYWLQKLVMNK